MSQVALYQEAHGPCQTCGEESKGSFYWTPLPTKVWKALRPSVAHLFEPDKIQNVLFVPQFSKPFCGPRCSLDWRRADD